MAGYRASQVRLTEEQKRVLSKPAQLAELARMRAEAELRAEEDKAAAAAARIETAAKREAVRAAQKAEIAERKAQHLKDKAERAARVRVATELRESRRGRPSNNPGGKPKGALNQLKLDVKQMILGALERAGGVEYLLAQAELNPVAFMSLVGKVLPMQVTGADGGPIEGRVEHVITFVAPSMPASIDAPRAPKRIVDSSAISDAVEVAVRQTAEDEQLW